ncbi:UNVERIFIED_CONTAM: hypothetical protein RMT77_008981 [Armadillidium vulgare]
MSSGNRCGCRALSELDEERARHQETIEENFRYINKIQDLHEELEALHSTVADLERRYSELSSRHRKTLLSLDEVSDTKERLKDHSSDVAESNRRLKLTVERLQNELKESKLECEAAKEEAEEERRKRISTELSVTRDLEEADRSCHAQLRRAASIHDLDSQHLKKDITRLQCALEREKYRHSLTKRSLQHANLHISQVGAFCHHHNMYGCPHCFLIP